MKSWLRWTVLGAIVVIVLAIIVFKGGGDDDASNPELVESEMVDSGAVDDIPCCSEEEWVEAVASQDPEPAALPRMLELGSVGCRPCKMMEPILGELRQKFAGKLDVEFYDVKADPTIARQYGIKLIPTQIFIDSEGNEVFRHEGYFPMEEILPVLAQMGVTE